MNRFTKVCLVIAGITCALGLGTLISSIAMGATIYDLEDAIDRGDYSIVGTHVLTPARDHRDDYKPWDEEYDEEYSESDIGAFSGIKELDVEMAAGEFYIEESDTDRINVETSGPNGKKTTIVQEDKKLKIYNDYNLPYDGAVTLYCPSGMKFDEIEISLGGGEAFVGVPLEAKKFEVEIGAGSFESTEPIIADKTDWSVSAGELFIDQLTSDKTEFDCGAGTIEAYFTGKRTDYNYELKCGMGQITIGDEEHSGVSTEKRENNNASRKIEAECAMGTITLDFEE